LAKRIVALVLVVILLTTGYWFVWGHEDAVAFVNGEPITRKELAARVNDVLAEYASSGEEITAEVMAGINQDVLDELITETLLVQAAADAGVTVTDEDVDAYYGQLADEYGGEEAFLELLRENGYTVARFREEVARQMAIQQYIERYVDENIDPAVLEVTEDEMRELYDYYAEQYGEIPAFDEVKEYLAEELRGYKLDDLRIVDQIIGGLREKAQIKITL